MLVYFKFQYIIITNQLIRTEEIVRDKPPRFETNLQHEHSERRRKIRGNIAKTATGIGLSLLALLATDNALGAHVPTETKLVEEYPDYYTGALNNKEAIKNSIISFVLPGFHADSQYIDNQVGPILDQYGTHIKDVYGDDLSVEVLAKLTAEKIESLTDQADSPIVFYGHSAGGDTAIEVIALLIEKYHVDPNRLSLILDCTPASNDDVNTDAHQLFIDFLDWVHNSVPFRGGPIARFTAETINAMTDGLDLTAAIERGRENMNPAPQEMSNAVVVAQAHIINDQPPLIHAANALKTHGVPVAFIAPGRNGQDEYLTDGIVHNQSANADWKARFGKNLTDYLITGHNLHGIQKRNKDDYAVHIDSFLANQGINPYQQDLLTANLFFALNHTEPMSQTGETESPLLPAKPPVSDNTPHLHNPRISPN